MKTILTLLAGILISLPWPLLVWGQDQKALGKPVVVMDAGGVEITRYKESHALLVGVSDYTHGWPKLESIPAELNALQKQLEARGFQVRRVDNPQGVELEDCFRNFVRDYGYVKENRLLFFYSGHGHTLDNGKTGFLVPCDAPNPNKGEDEEIEFRQKSFQMESILALSRQMTARHALFLFDSCFSGTIFRSRDLPKAPPHITAMMGKPVRQFITAGGAGEEVPAVSAFTPLFGRALDGEADFTGDGYITGTEIGQYLSQKVPEYKPQNPQYGKIKDVGLDEGDFLFEIGKKETTRDIPTPVKPVEPGGGDFNVEELEKRAREREAAMAKWKVWQENMQQSFGKVEALETGGLLTTEELHAAWGKYLESFREDNPHSIEDEQLREKAKGRLAYWAKKKQESVQPVNMPMPQSQSNPATSDSGENFAVSLPGGEKLELVWIKPGNFTMGSPESEKGRDNDEVQHEVMITKGYWLGKYEVTVGQFRAFVDATGYQTEAEKGDGMFVWNGSSWNKEAGKSWRNVFTGDEKNPVVGVSWNDAVAYCEWLTRVEKAAGRLPSGYEYRLPTEAQWEYACRAGSMAAYGGSGNLADMGWYHENSGKTTHPVGQKKANAWGLYDMHGNVWEWCSDWYGGYPSGGVSDPSGAISGSSRVSRGGGWSNNARYCRSANRNDNTPSIRHIIIGFRPARSSVP